MNERVDPTVDPVLEAARQRGAPRRWRIFGGIWLLYLIHPLSTLIDRTDGEPVRRAAGVLGLAAFVALYLWPLPMAVMRPPRHPSRYAIVLGLFAIALAMLPLTGEPGITAFVFVVAAAAMLLPAIHAAVLIVLVITLSGILPVAVPGWSDDPASTVFMVAVAAIAVVGFAWLLRSNRELRAAREELARLAVAEERGRFARDLHDILGHSLTVITVKAGLARRLVDRDPARAMAEIAEIEQLARAALGDVRATVAGYRRVSLASELVSARAALDATDILADLPRAIDEIPGDRHELFGWVVREGVTNVVRHSGARSCTVRLTPTSVEIVDDGHGVSGTADGHGLAGLAERVTAAGGQFQAGNRPGGGFRLYITLPATLAPDGLATPRPQSEAPV
jgi:two-component system, NarL family, sensor histidine kinase DesK